MDQQMQPQETSSSKTGMWVGLSILLTALIVGGGVFMWQQSSLSSTEEDLQAQIDVLETQVMTLEEDMSEAEESTNPESSSSSSSSSASNSASTASTCDFTGASLADPFTANDDIGLSAFETLVCGHLETKTETLFDTEYERVYLVVDEYDQEIFQTEVQGRFSSGEDEFVVGCYVDGSERVQAFPAIDTNRFDPQTEAALEDATSTQPATLKITGVEIDGNDNPCSSFGMSFELYE